MADVFDKLRTSFSKEERARSSFWKLYILSFVIINWKPLLYLLLSPENNKVSLLAKELPAAYFDMPFFDVPDFLRILVDVFNTLWIVGIPFGLSFLLLKYLPIIHKHFFRNDIESHYDRKRIADYIKKEYAKDESDAVQETTSYVLKTASAFEEQAAKEAEVLEKLTDEQKWELAYKDISTNLLFQRRFEEILQLIYEKEGVIEGKYSRNISYELLSFCHTNEILEYVIGSRNIVELTKKGKYIIAKYQRENGK